LTQVNLIFARTWDNRRVTPIRSRRFAWLALVAMLSLALLPTLGRLASGHQHARMAMAHHAMASPMPAAVMVMPASHQMHHGANAASDPLASRNAHAEHAGVEHGNEHEGHEGHDCGYCLLLSGLVGAATLQWLPAASRIAGQPSMPAFTNRRIDAPVPALGGQGPPSIDMG
jgi:hypothetical protein